MRGVQFIHPSFSFVIFFTLVVVNCRGGGAEIIHSIHALTNHFVLFYIWCSSSFLGPKSFTANVSLIVRIIHLAVCVSHSMGPEIIHLMHPLSHSTMRLWSSTWYYNQLHISIDLSYITRGRDHPPRVRCVSTIWGRDHPPYFCSYTLIVRSWTDTHHLSWGRDHSP